jgi:hypothetical protein
MALAFRLCFETQPIIKYPYRFPPVNAKRSHHHLIRQTGCASEEAVGKGGGDIVCVGGDPPPGRARAQCEIEVNDFNRRQTDTGVLMLLKTNSLMAEYAARRLRL